MNPRDDVRADLASRRGLTRPQMRQILDLLERAPAGGNGVAVTVALRSLLPEAAKRLASATAAEATDYLAALEATMIAALHL